MKVIYNSLFYLCQYRENFFSKKGNLLLFYSDEKNNLNYLLLRFYRYGIILTVAN